MQALSVFHRKDLLLLSSRTAQSPDREGAVLQPQCCPGVVGELLLKAMGRNEAHTDPKCRLGRLCLHTANLLRNLLQVSLQLLDLTGKGRLLCLHPAEIQQY